jgi:hypothetical protein
MMDFDPYETEDSVVRGVARVVLAGLFAIPAMMGAAGVLGLVMRLAAGDADDGGAGPATLLTGLGVAVLLLCGGISAARNRFGENPDRTTALVCFAIAAVACLGLVLQTDHDLATLAAGVAVGGSLLAGIAAWLRL